MEFITQELAVLSVMDVIMIVLQFSDHRMVVDLLLIPLVDILQCITFQFLFECTTIIINGLDLLIICLLRTPFTLFKSSEGIITD